MANDQDPWNSPKAVEQSKIAEKAIRPFADALVRKAGIETYEGKIDAFDFASRTGALVAALYDALPKDKWANMRVLRGDISEPMLQWVKQLGEKEGWEGLETRFMNGSNTGIPAESYTHLFCNFSPFMMSQEDAGACFDLLKPGGFIGVTSFAEYPWYPYLIKAGSLLSLPIPSSSSEAGKIFYQGRPVYDPDYLQSLVTKAGFQDVKLEKEEHTVAGVDPATFMEPMALPLGVLVGSFGDEVDKEKALKDLIVKMQEVLEGEFGKEGPVTLTWKAYVATGSKAS